MTGGRVEEAIVIGGGIGGLTAAFELVRRGIRPVVIESSDRVGGYLTPLTLTDRAGAEHFIDAGADSFATRTDAVAVLAQELGLSTVSPSPVGAWCVPALGNAFPLPKAGSLGIPFDFDAPDLLVALGAEGVARARADASMPALQGDRSNLAVFVESRMGSAVLERLVRPVAGGVHSTDPEKLDVTVLHPRFWEFFEQAGTLSGAMRSIRSAAPAGSAVSGIDGGMYRLPASLADAVRLGGGRILTNSHVQHMRRDGESWLVEYKKTDKREVLSCSRVVVATPAKTAIKLLSGAGVLVNIPTPDLPHGSDICLVTLVVECPRFARDGFPRGTGALMAPGGSIAAKGSTHVNAKWQWLNNLLTSATTDFHASTQVIRLSFGRHGERMNYTDEEIIAQATKDFVSVYGPLTPTDFTIREAHVVRWSGALAPMTPAMKAFGRAASHRVTDYHGLAVTGAWLSGTGVSQVIPHAQNAILRIS